MIATLQNLGGIGVVPVLLVMSLCLRQILILAGQQWISTFAHTATLCTLPVITYVITSVISGNIALSLGMVGALSIVRFRNPVKSPLELATYFTMITLGIAASVSMTWLFLLAVSIVGIILFLLALNKYTTHFHGKPTFRASFTEGNELSTLEIHSDEIIDGLIRHPYTIASSSSPEGFRYVFASNSRQDLIALQEDLQANATVKTTNLTI